MQSKLATVASVTKGLLTIKGGEFNLQNVGQYGYTYLINCIDANYPASANVVVTGGKFYGFNPENNAAEGAGTDFCAEGYFAVETGENVYEVVEHTKTHTDRFVCLIDKAKAILEQIPQTNEYIGRDIDADGKEIEWRYIYYGVPTNFVSEWGERRHMSL